MSGKPGRPAIPKTTCSVAGCGTISYSRGMCKLHYNRVWRHGSADAGDIQHKFSTRTEKSGECLVWIGAKFQSGYGKITYKGRSCRAHRVGYELNVGPIPKGMNVLHRCDNPPCVNPSHLFLGTHIDNMRDMEAKGRAKWIQENLRRKL